MMHLLVGGFRPRYTSVEHENLDNSVFEDAAAPRAMFDEDQEQNEPPPMHRSKSSLGAQSRGILHYTVLSFSIPWTNTTNAFCTLLSDYYYSPSCFFVITLLYF